MRSSQVKAPAAGYERTVAVAISAFGASVKPKLLAATSHREDQLRAPVENLLKEVGKSLSLEVIPVGEQELTDKSRPDYLIRAIGVAVGHIELKAPGRGVEPNHWPVKSHDRIQWERIKALPNLLYSDGNSWALYHNGHQSGGTVRLIGDVAEAGGKLAPPDAGLAKMFHEFLNWKPSAPRSLRNLVQGVSGLCSLLRADVFDRVERERSGKEPEWFTHLARDWRRLLFPGASDQIFADQYAQTVTFALLLARVEGIDFDGQTLPEIAQQLGKKHSLMGRALSLLTEDAASELGYVLESLLRVIGVVDWSKLDDGTGNSYLKLYEDFLELYDPKLRRETGSYYTPVEVASFMTTFTEKIVKRRLKITKGFASDRVVIVDPAMGTGTFLLDIIEKVASSVAPDGDGAITEHLRSLAGRLIGFEKQTGPYAVAELRTYQALMNKYRTEPPAAGLRYYVADTLDDPYQEPDSLGRTYEPIARSLRAANKVKRDEPVMVVIGNPPYRERSKTFGKWITNGTRQEASRLPFPEFDSDEHGTLTQIDAPPLEAFIPKDIRSSAGAHLKHLHNLYIYFWRWATWKVFDAHPNASTGVVAFITTSGYLAGPGFVGMREYLRKTADEGWIIDLSPEGPRPPVNSRIFPGVQHPICIGIFVRKGIDKPDKPATVRYTSIAGKRTEKYQQLGALDPDEGPWVECPEQWRESFLPPLDTGWASFPELSDILLWSSPGVKPNRTWVRSPSEEVLRKRWQRLNRADEAEKSSLFKESRDANMDSTPESITSPGTRMPSFRNNPGNYPKIEKYGARSFDIQYVIADPRVINDPRVDLWRSHGARQLYISELHNQPIIDGPAVTFTAFVPDMHHFKGSGGGRVFPLYRDSLGKISSLNERLIAHLADNLNISLTAEDIASYIAAVAAHPAYTQRFEAFLRTSGVRVPLTMSKILWNEAVEIGREVIWLHTRGLRFSTNETGCSDEPPRMPEGLRPKLNGVIAPEPSDIPETICYDSESHTLHIGHGTISPVPAKVWSYNVSGMNVLGKWFSYRKLDPAGKRTSELDHINSDIWLPNYSTDLLDLLNVLCRLVALEPAQESILDRICTNPTISTETLASVGVLPPPQRKRKLTRNQDSTGAVHSLFDEPGSL